MKNASFRYIMICLLACSLSKIAFAEDLKEQGHGLYVYSCAGLVLSDHGMSMDREAFFYSESSHKLLCVSAMGSNKCAVHAKDKICTCPPPEWQSNGCWDKYSKFLKTGGVEYRLSLLLAKVQTTTILASDFQKQSLDLNLFIEQFRNW